MLPDSIPDEIIKAIKQNRCVLFLGAGLSKGANPSGKQVPDGGGLAKQYAAGAKLCTACEHATGVCQLGYCKWPLQITARYYETKAGNALLHTALRDVFVSLQPLPVHYQIADLAPVFPRIITTNYDTMLETAFEKKGVTYRLFLRDLIQDPEVPPQVELLKMHGCIRFESKTWVITDDSYYEFVSEVKSQPYARFVQTLTDWLSNYSVIYVGYSLSDSTFRTLHHDILKQRKDYDKLPDYAVLGRPGNDHEQVLRDLDKLYWQPKHHIHIIDLPANEFFDHVTDQVKSIEAEIDKAIQKAIDLGRPSLENADLERIKRGYKPRTPEQEQMVLQTWMSCEHDYPSSVLDTLNYDKVLTLCQKILTSRDKSGGVIFNALARAHATRALGREPKEEALIALFEGLEDTEAKSPGIKGADALVRAGAADVLTKYPFSVVFNGLYDRLKFPDQRVRKQAASVLARLPRENDTRPKFVEKLSNESLPVQKEILDAFDLSGLDGAARFVSAGLEIDRLVPNAIKLLASLPCPQAKWWLKYLIVMKGPKWLGPVASALEQIPQLANTRLLVYIREHATSTEDHVYWEVTKSLENLVRNRDLHNGDSPAAHQVALEALIQTPDRDEDIKYSLVHYVNEANNEIAYREWALRKLPTYAQGEELFKLLEPIVADPNFPIADRAFSIILYKLPEGIGKAIKTLENLLSKDREVQTVQKIEDLVKDRRLTQPAACKYLIELHQFVALVQYAEWCRVEEDRPMAQGRSLDEWCKEDEFFAALDSLLITLRNQIEGISDSSDPMKRSNDVQA